MAEPLLSPLLESSAGNSVRAGEVVRVVDGVRMLETDSVSSTVLDKLEGWEERPLTSETDMVGGRIVLDF